MVAVRSISLCVPGNRNRKSNYLRTVLRLGREAVRVPAEGGARKDQRPPQYADAISARASRAHEGAT